MKRKTYGATPVKVIKTSISLPEVLLKFAEEQCATEGFNSVSAYLAHLVRLAKERDEEKKTPGSSSGHGHFELNEEPSSQAERELQKEVAKQVWGAGRKSRKQP